MKATQQLILLFLRDTSANILEAIKAVIDAFDISDTSQYEET